MNKKLAELRAANIKVEPLLKNPALFMSVAQVGPKTAYDIYVELGRKPSLKQLETIYNKIDDKTKMRGRKLVEKKEKPVVPVQDARVSHPLNILKDHKIPIQDVLGVFKVVLGTTGTGKSNTVAVIIEEYLKYDVPIHIIDIEGEHTSFVKEKGFELLNKRNYHTDNIKGFLKRILKRRDNLLIDVSSFDTGEDMEFLKDYLTTLWDLEDKMRVPLSLVIEEVHTLIPQGAKTPVKPILQTIAKRGRKRKIEAIFVTQRSQEADKSIITQAETAFLHKVSHPANLAIYRVLIPNKKLFAGVENMKIGEVIYVNRGEAVKSMVRVRNTKHGSHTLSVGDLKKPKGILSLFGGWI
jgi:hypothetical protein